MSPGDEPLTLLDFASKPVGDLVGVGPKKLQALASAEIATLHDLLLHYPLRYIPGDEAMVLGEVVGVDSRRTRNGKSMVTVSLSDGSGKLSLSFFNQPWRAKQMYEGMQAVVFGKVDLYRGSRQMSSPIVDLVGDKTGRIVPVYPQSAKAGLHTWDVAEWVAQVLRRSSVRGFAEAVPQSILDRWNLVSRDAALRMIHQPESMGDVDMARRRLVFDELLRIQCKLVRKKRVLEAEQSGVAHNLDGTLFAEFLGRLGFPLTKAQERVISEIHSDLGADSPMHRLLQGDVGSGKTVVAVAALLTAVEGGHQGALMAPTEVLAEQHYRGISALLSGLTVRSDLTLLGERELRVAFLAGRVGAAERRRIRTDLANGEIDIAIGTHALIQEGVDFNSLGDRRTTPLRCRTTGRVAREKRRRHNTRCAGHDCHPDTSHRGHDGLWRPRCFGA